MIEKEKNQSNRTLFLLSSGFGGRGSLMLRAALNDQGQQVHQLCRPLTTTNKQFIATSSPSVKLSGYHQKMDDSLSKSKSRVLFSEPLVTDQYEYEQTFVELDHLSEEDRAASVHSQLERLIARRKAKLRKKLERTAELAKDQDILVEHYRRLSDSDGERCMCHVKSSQSEVVQNDSAGSCHTDKAQTADDDDDDELFILAPTSFIDEHEPEPESESNVTPKKRTHDDALDHNDHGNIKRKIRCFSDETAHDNEGGSLFSSPKVAKVAPFYYREPFDKQQSHQETHAQDLKAPCAPARFLEYFCNLLRVK